ncbi:hypothetical protein ACOSQ2_015408 [Xanthoceras sorbifolium]
MEDEKTLLLKYERLSEYCFCCGLLGYSYRECPNSGDETVIGISSEFEYGTWMQTSSLGKGRPSGFNMRQHASGHVDHSSQAAKIVDVDLVWEPVAGGDRELVVHTGVPNQDLVEESIWIVERKSRLAEKGNNSIWTLHNLVGLCGEIVGENTLTLLDGGRKRFS